MARQAPNQEASMPDERDRLAANDNEDLAEDEEVEAHARAGQSENANEDIAEDE
jgi:hypothetical protein